MRTLTLKRQGSFSVENVGIHWCGIYQKQHVRYHLSVVCALQLDSRGFLFDQLTVDSYFKSLGTVDESCERLVLRCAWELYKIIRKEHPACEIQSLSLMLSPAPYQASMIFDIDGETLWRDANRQRQSKRRRRLPAGL